MLGSTSTRAVTVQWNSKNSLLTAGRPKFVASKTKGITLWDTRNTTTSWFATERISLNLRGGILCNFTQTAIYTQHVDLWDAGSRQGHINEIPPALIGSVILLYQWKWTRWTLPKNFCFILFPSQKLSGCSCLRKIWNKLFISETTVKGYLQNIYGDLNVKDLISRPSIRPIPNLLNLVCWIFYWEDRCIEPSWYQIKSIFE